jgi:hypothetical protein
VSTFNELDVTCGACGEEFKGTVWTAIHAGQDPELKDLLLGGELNILFCPQCAHTFYYEHFLLYQEPRLHLVAYVYPISEESRRPELEVLMKRGFAEAQGTFDPKDRLAYGPSLFFGLDALQARIRHEEERLIEEEVAKMHEAHRRT